MAFTKIVLLNLSSNEKTFGFQNLFRGSFNPYSFLLEKKNQQYNPIKYHSRT